MVKRLRRGSSSPQNNERNIRRIEIDLNKVDDLQSAVAAIVPLSTILKGGEAILALSNNVSEDTVISEDVNSMSIGPITIAQGKTVTVEDGAVWKIL